MPNHCYNTVAITSTAEDIEKIKDKLKSDISHFDFNTLVPMPPDIADTAMMGAKGEEFYYSQKDWHEYVQDRQDENIFGPVPDIDWVFDNAIDDFTLRRRKAEHNRCWWYDFACLHWGTKWNAYDIEYKQFVTPNGHTKIIYQFTTAWAEPRPVIEKLIQYLCQPEFSQDLDLRWKFEEEAEHFKGVITKDDEV